ncbi:dehydratase [Epidermidibacterium keratini]|uniref:Dehydratase n=1 Tax=Epidermidibacterium keratini TaxID=1891644 RepID=A0A7L4YP17_9ACTN|nr:MaoC/PaaZ C-terminal domain-containing protein [Epidermidibacterium keratini]QHC00643.1 dehydratase [Epidermidibacterium keratini]
MSTLTELAEGAALPELQIDPISRTTLALFAGASNDHNPIHIDLDNARSAGLDDVFAHGMLSMAYLSRYLLTLAPQSAVRHFSTRFVSITPVHGAPTCSGTVASVGDDGTVELELAVRLADGTVTLAGRAVVEVAS